MKHSGFNSFAWDLGTFDQILHNSVFEGRPFYYTLDLFMNPSGHYFAIHFSPILMLLAPLYRLFPGPCFLLAAKSLAVGAAAYPLALLTGRLTGNTRTGVTLGFAYLLNPCIQGANWFDFQPQCLLPLLVFTAYYLLDSGSTLPYLATIALTLSVEEHSSAIVIVMLGAYLLHGGTQGLKRSLSDNRTVLLIAATLALSVSALAVSFYFKQVYPPDLLYGDVYSGGGAYSALGFEGNAFSAPLYAVTHPADLLPALSFDAPQKLAYLVFLFAPLLFTPLRSGAAALGALLLVPFLLSNYAPYYMVGAHYPFYVMPLIFVSASRFLGRHRGGYETATAILASTTVFALVLSPLSPASATFTDSSLLWYPANNMTPQDTAQLTALIAKIPGDASILTQNHIFPHASGRIDIYCIPVTRFSDHQISPITTYLATLKERSDYILLDNDDGNPLTPIMLKLVEDDANYHPLASAGEVTLWMRTPKGEG